MTKFCFRCFLLFTLAAVVSLAEDLVNAEKGKEDFFACATLAPISGIEATLTPIQGAKKEEKFLQLDYAKSGEERRFLAVETFFPTASHPCKVAVIEVESTIDTEQTAVPAVMIYEQGGACWIFRNGKLQDNDGVQKVMVGLTDGREAAFCRDGSGRLEWNRVEKIQFGFVVDGKGEGRLVFHDFSMGNEMEVPAEAVSILQTEPSRWSLSADPAVSGKSIVCVKEGKEKVLKMNFTFPGGRHMYFTPSQAAMIHCATAYDTLQLTYRTPVLPPSLNQLLIMLHDGGAQYCASAPFSKEWRTIDLPFSSFKLAAWTKDANKVLDLSESLRTTVGCHGTASKKGEGIILLKDMKLVPRKK